MKIGEACSFYHEGGRGERRWVIGWRYGVVRAIPIKGQHKHWVQVEIPVRLYSWDELKKRWQLRPFVRAWIHSGSVNPVGDTVYHGTRLVEEVKERKEQKATDQAKANRKVRRK
jgi:hypothetical protein